MGTLEGRILPENIVIKSDAVNEGSCKVLTQYKYINLDKTEQWISRGAIYIYLAPTGNCQLWSIAYVNEILLNYKNAEELLAIIIKKVNKNLLFIDINRNHIEIVKKIFGNKIIADTPYVSTNGSNMNSILINVKSYF